MSDEIKTYRIMLIFLVLIILAIYQIIPFTLKQDFFTYVMISLLTILSLYPLFTEIKIFDIISIKKDFDEFKENINQKLFTIQNTVISSISQTQNVNIFPYPPYNKSETHLLNEKLINKIGAKRTEVSKVLNKEFKVDDIRVDLFKIRYLLEKKLNQLYIKNEIGPRRLFSIKQLSDILFKNRVIDSNIHNGIDQIGSYLSSTIHGMEIEKTNYKLVLDTSKNILYILDKLLLNTK